MSKYDALCEFVQKNGSLQIQLTSDEIHDIVGICIDHSFLDYKKGLPLRGIKSEKFHLRARQSFLTKLIRTKVRRGETAWFSLS